MILVSVSNFIISTTPDRDACKYFWMDPQLINCSHYLVLEQNVGIFTLDLITTAFFTFDYIMRFVLTRDVRFIWVWANIN